jgi:hypothetical protein
VLPMASDAQPGASSQMDLAVAATRLGRREEKLGQPRRRNQDGAEEESGRRPFPKVDGPPAPLLARVASRAGGSRMVLTLARSKRRGRSKDKQYKPNRYPNGKAVLCILVGG